MMLIKSTHETNTAWYVENKEQSISSMLLLHQSMSCQSVQLSISALEKQKISYCNSSISRQMLLLIVKRGKTTFCYLEVLFLIFQFWPHLFFALHCVPGEW